MPRAGTKAPQRQSGRRKSMDVSQQSEHQRDWTTVAVHSSGSSTAGLQWDGSGGANRSLPSMVMLLSLCCALQMSDNGHHDDDEYDPNADIDMQPVRQTIIRTQQPDRQPRASFLSGIMIARAGCWLIRVLSTCVYMCAPLCCLAVAAGLDRCLALRSSVCCCCVDPIRFG